jgi:cell wall-associated NlpC family hydrolase
MRNELERSAALIERLLADPDLRRRFRADAASVLGEHGLAELAREIGSGERALLTLELRESRSSLAGAMVAAAAEGVDVTHLAEHAAPGLEHAAGRALDKLARSFGKHSAAKRAPAPAAATKPAAPQLDSGGAIPELAARHQPTGPTAPAPTGSGQQAEPRHAGAHNHRAAAASPEAPPEPHHSLLDYPGNDAIPRQLAAWMAAHAKRAGLPPELPVMAALTESGLRNVPYGDRDSVGFFQMRTGIWDEGPYKNFLEHPGRQMKWFIEHALAVREANPSIAASPDSWGQWVADIEQPAAQYRFRYQLQLSAARELLRGVDLSAVDHAGQHGEHVAQQAAQLTPHVVRRVRVGKQALAVAMRYLGTPYKWGGSSPTTGFDCSGLVQWAYAQEGIHLPRVAADQFGVGIPVAREDLRPGDAVFFKEPDGYVHHVGLYIGDGRFINAPETGENVKISSLSDPYFAAQYAGARRYTVAALGDPARYARTLRTVNR